MITHLIISLQIRICLGKLVTYHLPKAVMPQCLSTADVLPLWVNQGGMYWVVHCKVTISPFVIKKKVRKFGTIKYFF